jgi:hypothetical protein
MQAFAASDLTLKRLLVSRFYCVVKLGRRSWGLCGQEVLKRKASRIYTHIATAMTTTMQSATTNDPQEFCASSWCYIHP